MSADYADGKEPVKVDDDIAFEVEHERSRLKVGSRVWVFDGCRRIYLDEEGNRTSSCHRSAFWVEREVIGETRVSWIVGYVGQDQTKIRPDITRKIPKKHPEDARGICFSLTEVRLRLWAEANRYLIGSAIQHGDTSIEKLAAVAKLIGYREMNLPRYVTSDDLHEAAAKRRPRET